LIELIDADPGNDPDLGYRLLMEQSGRFGTGNVRREEELTDPNFQPALDRWAHRSHGVALKFALTHWHRAKKANKESFSHEEIAWLIDLMGNGKYAGPSAKGWEAETKRLLPYRFVFQSPTSILTSGELHSQALINAALKSDIPAVRASAVEVLSGRAQWKRPVEVTGLEDQLIRLSTDNNTDVRRAVAGALGAFEAVDLNRVIKVLHRLSQDDDLFIVEAAIRSLRNFSADVTPEQVADVFRSTMRLSGNPGGRAVNTLEAIANKAGPSVSDKLIDVGLQFWNSTGHGDSKVIHVLAYASRHCSDDRREKAITVLCQAMQDSDGYDEMAAVTKVGALADVLSPASRYAAMGQLMQIIEGPLEDREVRISQAARAATHIAPLCESLERKKYVTRLCAILNEAERSQAAALVLGSLGSESEEAVMDLQTLTRSDDGFTCVAAARALWKIKPNAKLCGETYIRVMHSGTDYPRRVAKFGMIEMGADALVVGDQMVELLKHKRCYFLIEDVFEKIGPTAAALTDRVTPLLEHKDRKTRSAAEKVLTFITAQDPINAE